MPRRLKKCSNINCTSKKAKSSVFNTAQVIQLHINLFSYIYILGVFTENPYGKLLESNIVYIPITTWSHATSVTSKINMSLCYLIGRRRHHDVTDAVLQLAEKLHVNVLLLHF